MTDTSETPAAPGMTVAGVTSYLSAAPAAAWGVFVSSITSWPKVAGVAILALASLAYVGKISTPEIPYPALKTDIAELRAEMTHAAKSNSALITNHGAMREEISEILTRLESLEAARAKQKQPAVKRPPT